MLPPFQQFWVKDYVAMFLIDLTGFFIRDEHQSKAQSPDLICIITHRCDRSGHTFGFYEEMFGGTSRKDRELRRKAGRVVSGWNLVVSLEILERGWEELG